MDGLKKVPLETLFEVAPTVVEEIVRKRSKGLVWAVFWGGFWIWASVATWKIF